MLEVKKMWKSRYWAWKYYLHQLWPINHLYSLYIYQLLLIFTLYLPAVTYIHFILTGRYLYSPCIHQSLFIFLLYSLVAAHIHLLSIHTCWVCPIANFWNMLLLLAWVMKRGKLVIIITHMSNHKNGQGNDMDVKMWCTRHRLLKWVLISIVDARKILWL